MLYNFLTCCTFLNIYPCRKGQIWPILDYLVYCFYIFEHRTLFFYTKSIKKLHWIIMYIIVIKWIFRYFQQMSLILPNNFVWCCRHVMNGNYAIFRWLHISEHNNSLFWFNCIQCSLNMLNMLNKKFCS